MTHSARTLQCTAPIRTCIATREAHPDAELLRIVADPDGSGRILADPSRSLPGRGAWITPTLEAFELAEKRKAFARALRVSTPVDLGHVRTYLAGLTGAAKDPHKDRKTEH
ncbi:YlxR family protein [Corynebacterium qintianiae]|uniref:YlxR family protein n=1 Tax=Corynebacterium qintianiae TaxID=2709392 RepID=A0A7T0KLS4_9CORY|nr:YlxR family protein [Corynebacterium qintianiae]QPK82570.1 YlxR family protein [Corynebacterium qintianiae]